MEFINEGIASLGIAGAVMFGLWTTKQPGCLWALLIIPMVFGAADGTF